MTHDRKIWEMNASQSVPLGHAPLVVTNAAQGLPNLPSDTRRVVIRCKQPINWRDDGVAPTSATGMYLLADETFVYDGAVLSNVQFILDASATGNGDMRIAYYA